MDGVSILAGFVAGSALGGALAGGWALKRALAGEQARRESEQALQQALDAERARATAAEQRVKLEQAAAEARLADQRRFAEEMRQTTKAEFESLATQVLDARAKTFGEQSERRIAELLVPLRDRLQGFEKRVETSYVTEAKERHALKDQVERLMQLNERVNRETMQLTQVLKGDSKFQGDWGELVLERILEDSGLRRGIEYDIQANVEGEGGGTQRPDIIIRLPDDKHVIIDSKVSLKAYELWARAGSDEERARYLKTHLESLEVHVRGLAERRYARAKGIQAPDFVFLFLPLEPAYLLAAQADPELHHRSWQRQVAIVTSTTLFASLRTVSSIWKVENQNRNALKIAEEAGKLYDKFVGFLGDLETLGGLFKKGQETYEDAFRKLKEGPGNVIRRVENLRDLGAQANKRIDRNLLEE